MLRLILFLFFILFFINFLYIKNYYEKEEFSHFIIYFIIIISFNFLKIIFHLELL